MKNDGCPLKLRMVSRVLDVSPDCCGTCPSLVQSTYSVKYLLLAREKKVTTEVNCCQFGEWKGGKCHSVFLFCGEKSGRAYRKMST